jgi:anionic cell wall polymer biosynthesis LytR-Cps2A-Psr (LCP) family protein
VKRSRKTDKSIILLLLIIAVAVTTVVFALYQFRTDKLTNKLKEKNPIAILFLVNNDRQLTFMQLLLYHPVTKKGGLFYIPGNLGTKIESPDRFDRIEVLYSVQDKTPIKRKVEQILDFPVLFYFDMSLNDISNIVDLVGGLELFISNPVDIEYDGKRVLLPSGSVLLDGDKIKDYLTYEVPMEEDREKVGRKQKFLNALLKKMGSPTTSAYLLERSAFRLLRMYLKSNLTEKALRSFIVELGKLKSDRLIFQRVLGSLKQVEGVDGPILFPHYEGNLIKQTIRQNLETISSDDPKYDDTLTISIEILNGTTIDGLAKRTKTLYESFGFDVVSYRNADHDQYLNTLVLDRKGESFAAERVAEVIKCERIHSKLDQEKGADITLILGKDFDGRYCKK